MSYDDRPDSPIYQRRRFERRLLIAATLAVVIPVAVLLWLVATT